MSVSLFDVGQGAGLGCCRGEVGELGRFCTLLPSDCTTGKHVENKADLKPFHAYMLVGLGHGGRRAKNVATIGCCFPLETFREHKVWALNLSLPGTQWRHFGDNLKDQSLSDNLGLDTVDMGSLQSILVEVKRMVSYSLTTPAKRVLRRF
jgi:hypothetical protein